MTLIDQSTEPLPRLAPRESMSHKGTYGAVLIVGGSRGMAGAAALCGLSAMRSGAGLVTVATAASVQSTVALFSPSYMTIPLVEDEDGLLDFANVVDLAAAKDRFSVWAIGPGLGRSAGLAELVAQLYREVPRPMVVDADGLFALAEAAKRNPKVLDRPAGPRVLTPHMGEFLRLTDLHGHGSPSEKAEDVSQLCRRDSSNQTVVLLKWFGQTIVCDGRGFAVNETGNPGLATGGTGDCLTGVIAALLGQGMTTWEAARLGAHVHGLAGDLAARELGQISLISSDLPNFLPRAFMQLAAEGK